MMWRVETIRRALGKRKSLYLHRASVVFLFTGVLLAAGCGYTLQNARTNNLREIGVERVYVAPVKNLSYKPGVENLFYNELVQILLAGKRVKIVDLPENSDAILESTVVNATYAPTTKASANSIFPASLPAIEIMVATEYQATVSCTFALKRQKGGFALPPVLWESSFSRSRRFAANNQKIEYGTTSALINESEFDRTLREVAHGMMQDVHEAMIARF